MTPETARQAVDFSVRIFSLDSSSSEEVTFAFYGGEPLLNLEALTAALERIAMHKEAGRLPGRIVTRINTNGSLINPEIIELFKKYNVATGISIDGGRPAMNSCRRFKNGKETYARIMKGVNLLKANQLPFGVAVVLSEGNLKRGRELIESLIELKVSTLGFNPLVSTTKEDYGEDVARFLIEADKSFSPLGIVEERFFHVQRAFGEATITRFDCCATGGNQLAVSPDGRVGVCHGLVGSHEDFVTDIYDQEFDPRVNETFKKWVSYSPFFMPECQGCEALGLCGGGCPLRAFYKNQKWGGVDKQFCPSAKKIQEYLVWKLFDSLKDTKLEAENKCHEASDSEVSHGFVNQMPAHAQLANVAHT